MTPARQLAIATARVRALEGDKRITEAAKERAITADHLVTVDLCAAKALEARWAEVCQRAEAKAERQAAE
jgi:hypothetical protein